MNQQFWYKRKTYGWGWTPANWQGWLVTLLFFILMVAPAVVRPKLVSEHRLFLPLYVLILALIQIWICYIKGETPQWQWGKRNASD